MGNKRELEREALICGLWQMVEETKIGGRFIDSPFFQMKLRGLNDMEAISYMLESLNIADSVSYQLSAEIWSWRKH